MSHLPSFRSPLATVAAVVLAGSSAVGCDRLDRDSNAAVRTSAGTPPDDAKASSAAPDPDTKATPQRDASEPKPAPVEPTLARNEGPAQTPTPAVDPTALTTPKVDPLSPSARTEGEQNSVDVFQAAAPATVFVTQKAILEDFAMRAAEVSAGTGSGFIWDKQGHIVTNCHVALRDCASGLKAAKLSVTLYDHSVLDATLVGFDPTKDIAVLKIDPKSEIVPMRRPPPDYDLVVGQKAIAIGNPFGLDHTMTVGVVSALGREVKGIGSVTIKDMVQTDAAINPGNSGGPLMDSSGQLLGMNTMIFSRSGSSAGIGFAVPYMSIERVVPQIIKDGRASRVGLGVSIFPPAFAHRLGIEGVGVQTVPTDTPAFKAGLRPAMQGARDIQIDFIVGVDGERIKSYDDLYSALDGKSAGDKVKLSVMRLPQKKVFDAEIELIDL